MLLDARQFLWPEIQDLGPPSNGAVRDDTAFFSYAQWPTSLE